MKNNNKNPTDLAALRTAVMMLAMDGRARDALKQMDLDDARQVNILGNVLRAGAMTGPNRLRLLAALADKGCRPSRGMLEELLTAVRSDPRGRAELALAGI